MHGQKWSAGGLGQFHEILPAIGIFTHLPHDALPFFVVHESVETAHAVAFDEGDHVVFYGGEIVWNGRHIGMMRKATLYAVRNFGASKEQFGTASMWARLPRPCVELNSAHDRS